MGPPVSRSPTVRQVADELGIIRSPVYGLIY